jgi:hypothetical protein
VKHFCRGRHTESADSQILEIIPPLEGFIPTVRHLCYTTPSLDAHRITFMRPAGQTVMVEETRASGTGDLIVETIAAGFTVSVSPVADIPSTMDWVAWESASGVIEVSDASFSGNAVSVSNIDYDTKIGGKVWFFWGPARGVHIPLELPENTRNVVDLNISSGVPRRLGLGWDRSGVGEPLLVYIDNINDQGTLEYLWGDYVTPDDVEI